MALPALRPAAEGATAPALRVAGSTDLPVFEPVLRDYQRLHPEVAIRYEKFSTQALYQEAATGQPPHAPSPVGPADLLASSSMDLQARLANDGHAQPHRSDATAALPGWARWRDEVFGFSYEPMVIAYDTRCFTAATAPATHRQLLDLLRDPARPLQGRIGTYDLQASGIGYLAATQDARIDGNAGALPAALADNRAVRAEHASALLDRIAAGTLALAYNMPGSYVQGRIAAGAPIGMVLPRDYTLVIAHTALIPRNAPHPAEARRFLDYLLSPRGQTVLARESRILPIRADVERAAHPTGALRPIPLGPGLLVYQDQRKRARFLEVWSAGGGAAAAVASPIR
ncbi:ABC transporter substrate-binding protein [Xylophilus ampelinus]|uniref:Iron(III) transport system substrate-binding protein n=1 Tax=Xylophilus ampelinus TaxID=54067 RepID=A0A318SH90_9BURK|nr:ABC transporter substrate-binding protein [Xylophilus ampelinus]MCS4510189.1 ABC transporter substrate-binding protein [Xylophilus ampelinus]PYE78193.1 iron(III) transport system substrate-binding protein [Xylophilus ampelinus]